MTDDDRHRRPTSPTRPSPTRRDARGRRRAGARARPDARPEPTHAELARRASRPRSATRSSSTPTRSARSSCGSRPDAWRQAGRGRAQRSSSATTSRSSPASTGSRRPSEGDEAGGDTSAPVQPTEMTFGAAGSDGPLPGVRARAVDAAGTGASRSRSTSTRPAARWPSRGCPSTPAPTGTSASAGRCSASCFDGHPSLRHLYLPAEFEGHPLRKDFPLLVAGREAVARPRRRRADARRRRRAAARSTAAEAEAEASDA